MAYFAEADRILRLIVHELQHMSYRCALVAGGGYSYESVRYLDPAFLGDGDLDLILVLEDIHDVLSFVSFDLLQRIGYSVAINANTMEQDLRLFDQGIIGIIRVSGHVGTMKVGVNVTTFDFLRDCCSTTDSLPTNKVAHSQTYSIIVSAGTDGIDLTIAKVSPNISGLYESPGPHHLILDKNWYQWDGVLHSGTYTDFVGSGRVIYDTADRAMARIRLNLLSLMCEYACPYIAEHNQWERLFANRRHFSLPYRDRLREELKALRLTRGATVSYASDSADPPQSVPKLRTIFLTSSSDYWYSPHLLNHPTASNCDDFPVVTTSESLWEQLPELACSAEGRLHLINAEVFRLSNLVSRTFGRTTAWLPSSMRSKDLVYRSGALAYRNPAVREVHVAQHILIEALGDRDDFLRDQPSSDTVSTTLTMLTDLRVDVALFLLRGNPSEAELLDMGGLGLLRLVRDRGGQIPPHDQWTTF